MSHLTDKYFAETGDKAMYRKGGADYHTLRYVKWLETKVEPFTSYNKQSTPCDHVWQTPFFPVERCRDCGKLRELV